MVEMTTEQFAAAEARGKARLTGPRAESAYYDVERDRIIVCLTNGIELGFAPSAAEGLQNVSVNDLKTIEIQSFGLGIHFPTIDADFYVPALLEGVLGSKRWMAAELGAVGGRARTDAKAAASRENGRLGGRPPRTVPRSPTAPQQQSFTTYAETIVAVFDTAAHAQAAIADLIAQGIPSGSIEHYAQSDEAVGGTTDTTQHRGGLWAWLTSESNATTSQHNALYDQFIQSGDTVVTVIADSANVDKIYSVIEAHNPVDLDEHHSQYSTSGAYGADTATAPVAATNSEEVLLLSEESLAVGKRQVDRSTTRVRRYVVERPVEEQIRLRNETVSVFRRPVTAGATVRANAFTDRVVGMTETDEEAVVTKSAHVVEEVVIQKGVEEHVETVRDTLRREEVEIAGPTIRFHRSGKNKITGPNN